MKGGVAGSLIGWYRGVVRTEMIGMLIAPLVVGIGHDDMRLLPSDEVDQRPHRLLKHSRRKGPRLAARWHIRVPVTEHPDPLIAQMPRCRGQLCTTHFRKACPDLRLIEGRIQDAPGFPACTADEHRAHPCRSIACYAAPAFGGLVVGMGMNGQ